ncbi:MULTISPECIES: hypothetical protein [unclassified Sphingomonas]|jgi:hypothetical protein|uniref:hypothetical protein n=1 Tax=unclassified Sphingomonas TaxID=196159 RepID=UPI00082F6D53|nr:MULTISPECIES: hypothetical protein [unclassified Sphingomonas]
MKLIALAAALAVSAPALAQTMPQTPTQQPTTPTAPAPDAGMTAPAQEPMAQQPMNGPTASTSPMTPAPAADAADPAGGYMPSGPALQGTPQPGAKVIVQQSVSPDQAFPAPAPMEKYPLCKRGQYDNCRQRGG